VLYNCASLANICVPGDPSSILINNEKQVPIIPLNIAKYRYNVPISFAFVEYNHLLHQSALETYDSFKWVSPNKYGSSTEEVELIVIGVGISFN